MGPRSRSLPRGLRQERKRQATFTCPTGAAAETQGGSGPCRIDLGISGLTSAHRPGFGSSPISGQHRSSGDNLREKKKRQHGLPSDGFGFWKGGLPGPLGRRVSIRLYEVVCV